VISYKTIFVPFFQENIERKLEKGKNMKMNLNMIIMIKKKV